MSLLTKNVAFDTLFLADNVRTVACQKIPAMVESLRRDGYKSNHPLVVHSENGRNLVLCGNRRTQALQWLLDNDQDAFHRVLPNEKVPCIVHKGLTDTEKVLLRVDHSSSEDRVPLDGWSLYVAVQQLVKVGIDTQEDIAIKLGMFTRKGKPNRSWVQPRVNLARLPGFVALEMEKHNADPKSTTLRWEHIPKLFKVYNEEFGEYPEGNGPDFLALWGEIICPKPETPKDTREKPLSVADAKGRAQAASSKTMRAALLCVTGQGKGTDFVALDAAMVEAETAVITLNRISNYLGAADYLELVQKANDQAQIVAEEAAKEEEPQTA